MNRETDKLVQKAQQAISKGNNELAKKYYLQAISLHPELPNLHYGLATVYYLQNNLEAAADHFKEVTRLDPLRAGAFINLGAVYNKLDRLDEAIAGLRKGIQLDLNRPEGFYNLGLVYRRKGQIDLAIQAYREATRLEPRMSDAQYNLANLYLEKGQHNLAIMHYELALDHRPNWEKAFNGLERTRQLLEEELGDIADEPTSFAAADDDEEAPTQKMLDPDRTVDPKEHGLVLTELHRATKETEELGREFMTLLQKEVEPAIKVLSNCLLQTNQSSLELDQCVRRVEDAMEHMNSAQKEFQSKMDWVQTHGEKLLES